MGKLLVAALAAAALATPALADWAPALRSAQRLTAPRSMATAMVRVGATDGGGRSALTLGASQGGVVGLVSGVLGARRGARRAGHPVQDGLGTPDRDPVIHGLTFALGGNF